MAPQGRNTRPTADRVRESLFNILAHGKPELRGASVLDAFAGSGALGFEALSRGAANVTFMETDGEAFAIIYGNARKLGAEQVVSVQRIDATRPPKARVPCRFVLMDPPYKSGLATPALKALNEQGWLAPDCLVVVEVAAGEGFSSPIKGLKIIDERTYGAARVVLLRFEAALAAERSAEEDEEEDGAD